MRFDPPRCPYPRVRRVRATPPLRPLGPLPAQVRRLPRAAVPMPGVQAHLLRAGVQARLSAAPPAPPSRSLEPHGLEDHASTDRSHGRLRPAGGGPSARAAGRALPRVPPRAPATPGRSGWSRWLLAARRAGDLRARPVTAAVDRARADPPQQLLRGRRGSRPSARPRGILQQGPAPQDRARAAVRPASQRFARRGGALRVVAAVPGPEPRGSDRDGSQADLSVDPAPGAG